MGGRRKKKKGNKESTLTSRKVYQKEITFLLTLAAGIAANWLAMKREVGPSEKMSSAAPKSASKLLRPLAKP